MTRALAAALLGLWATGCATAAIAVPAEDVSRIERELSGERRFLRVSMVSGPFFKDASKKLLSPVEPRLVRLLDDTSGHPIEPGPVEAVWPVGSAARIVKVEYPTGWVMTERVLYTPRALAWVYVELADAPPGAGPFVLVLRPGLKSADEFRAEVDRYLARDDLSPRLAAFSERVREAAKTRQPVVEMPAEALEMAWGYPDVRRIEFDGPHRKETWSWADGARAAVLIDGLTTELYPDGRPGR